MLAQAIRTTLGKPAEGRLADTSHMGVTMPGRYSSNQRTGGGVSVARAIRHPPRSLGRFVLATIASLALAAPAAAQIVYLAPPALTVTVKSEGTATDVVPGAVSTTEGFDDSVTLRLKRTSQEQSSEIVYSGSGRASWHDWGTIVPLGDDNGGELQPCTYSVADIADVDVELRYLAEDGGTYWIDVGSGGRGRAGQCGHVGNVNFWEIDGRAPSLSFSGQNVAPAPAPDSGSSRQRWTVSGGSVRKEFRGDEEVKTICIIVRPQRHSVFLVIDDTKTRKTTVQVRRGTVTVRNRVGARKKTVTVQAGQTATQKGASPPIVARRR